MKNSIKKVNSEFEIIEYNNEKTIIMKKKENQIIFHDERLFEDVIDKKFNEKYRKLLYIIMELNNSEDATEDDEYYVRSKIEELKRIIINKYAKHISRDLLNKYLKMLYILQTKLVIPSRGKGR